MSARRTVVTHMPSVIVSSVSFARASALDGSARRRPRAVAPRAATSKGDGERQCAGSCDSCGLARDKMQCDGSGRIQGGLAAIPLFEWWPIKAYRPCPGLIENGGVYTRKGQDVNSILWGESGKD